MIKQVRDSGLWAALLIGQFWCKLHNLILVLDGILSRVFVTPGHPFCLMISARHLDAFTSHLPRNLLHHLPFPLSFSHPLLHPDAYPV